MPQLHELQLAFAAAVVEGTSLAAVTSMEAGPSWRSVALYRRLMRNNYMQALTITYPVLHRLVGDRYFKVFARGYMKRYPSTSGDLFAYGQHFPLFLLQLKSPRLLIELARLEWACHEVDQATDTSPPSQAWWEAMASADPASVTFRLNPTVRLLQCSLPVHRVWHALQPGIAENEIGELLQVPGGTHLLVIRHHGKIRIRDLSRDQLWLLKAMRDRKTVSEVERMAGELMPDVDFSQVFLTLCEDHTGPVFSLEAQV